MPSSMIIKLCMGTKKKKKKLCIKIAASLLSIFILFLLFFGSRSQLTPLKFDSEKADPRYPINPHKVCSKRPKVQIVICVTAARQISEQRHAIRQTWGSYADDYKHDAILLFFVGRGSDGVDSKIGDIEESQLMYESDKYRDIVEGDYIDSYENLTSKSVSVLRWVKEYCHHAEYLLKIDSDMYVNFPSLLEKLSLAKRETNGMVSPFIFGYQATIRTPVRPGPKPPHSKWAVSIQDYPNKTYPEYILGAAYVIHRTAYDAIVKSTYEIPLLVVEDVYVTGLCGTWANQIRLEPTGIGWRHSLQEKDFCEASKKFAFIHGYSPQQFKEFYGHVKKKCAKS